MKGIKVIYVGSNPKDDVTFETCELCFIYGLVDTPHMVLEFPDGTQVTHDAYYWDLGDYCEAKVGNVVDFSAWLSEQELSDEDVEDLKDNKYVLIRLIDEYNNQKKEDDE